MEIVVTREMAQLIVAQAITKAELGKLEEEYRAGLIPADVFETSQREGEELHRHLLRCWQEAICRESLRQHSFDISVRGAFMSSIPLLPETRIPPAKIAIG